MTNRRPASPHAIPTPPWVDVLALEKRARRLHPKARVVVGELATPIGRTYGYTLEVRVHARVLARRDAAQRRDGPAVRAAVWGEIAALLARHPAPPPRPADAPRPLP